MREKNKVIFNELAIQTFSQYENEERAALIIESFYEKFAEILSSISAKNPIIHSDEYNMQILNEFSTQSYSSSSAIDIAFIINSPQLDYNTRLNVKNKFKSFLNKIAISWKIVQEDKKRKKKKKKQQKSKDTVIIPKNKYNMNDYQNDVFKLLGKYFFEKTVLVKDRLKIKIYSQEELGYNINLYLGLKVSENVFKIFDVYNNKYIEIDFKQRYQNISHKSTNSNAKYYKIARIFNNLYFNLMHTFPNQILLESILYNVPNLLFDKKLSIYDTFINIVCYLKMNTMQDFESIRDINTLIYKDELIKNNIIEFNDFLKQIEKYL